MTTHLQWHQAIPLCERANQPWAIATVLGVRGSTPRDAGTKMVITATETYDTVGGGKLEWLIINKARELFGTGKPEQHTEQLVLGQNTQQCCGGAVTLLLETFIPAKNTLHIFGAGHVAHALLKIVGELDLRVHWIDNRPEQFPAVLPINTQIHVYPNPVQHIEIMQPQAMALVLTHDHSLDYQLCTALLDRGDCRYIGLIGSRTKSLRFKKRLQSDAFSTDAINALNCPVGLDSVPGKQPMEVAVSIAGQIIQQLYCLPEPATKKNNRVSWQQLVDELAE
ncbi:xanthine dehydrogenase accessory protein XdhC [Teredinibacter turnerae]|uniref:xanthine dehydrogenase accessory protein XdhC n=1 Tax=Teredinibacter turnerae TaxID=2426 RepID=UPI0030CC16F3